MSQCIVSSNSNDKDGKKADRKRREPATWRELPRKGQLSILALCRLVDFLQISSLQAYIFYQVKSFDADLEDAEVSWQVGFLQGSFTAAQCFTAIMWGRAADASWCGRKTVLLISLLGTALSCFGLGFSKSFAQAVIFRIIGGGLNGSVGIMLFGKQSDNDLRKHQARKISVSRVPYFAYMIGPVIGGLMADKTRTSSTTHQVESKRGDEVAYSTSFPYAVPNIVNGVLLLAAALAVYLGSEETLESRSSRFDTGHDLGRRLISTISPFQALLRQNKKLGRKLEGNESTIGSRYVSGDCFVERGESGLGHERISSVPKESDLRLRFQHIWTPNLLSLLLAQALFDFHLGAFSSVLPLFLSAPHHERKRHDQLGMMHALPYAYTGTGGLGMSATSVGIGLAFLGAIGLILQVTLFPVIHSKLGTVQSFRLFSALFPLAYALMPILSLLSSKISLWAGIISILSILVTARTFTLPATIVLLNNSSPHPSVLGTVHAIGQFVSVLFRTIGSSVGGSWYGIGLQYDSGGEAWWNVGAIAVFGFLASWLIVEGSGHEIMFPGENPT